MTSDLIFAGTKFPVVASVTEYYTRNFAVPPSHPLGRNMGMTLGRHEPGCF